MSLYNKYCTISNDVTELNMMHTCMYIFMYASINSLTSFPTASYPVHSVCFTSPEYTICMGKISSNQIKNSAFLSLK